MFEVTRRQQLVIIIVAALFVFAAGYKYSQWKAGGREGEALPAPRPLQQEAQTGQVVVHVAGCVQKPGVYSLGPGARVADALGKAVALEEADLQAINLASPLKDGQKIFVPARAPELTSGGSVSLKAAGGAPGGGAWSGGGAPAGGTAPSVKQSTGAAASGTAAAAPRDSARVNINTASQAELETLPGIGPSLAGSIIKYREESGGFASEEDLKNVSGIGEKRYLQLKDLVSVY